VLDLYAGQTNSNSLAISHDDAVQVVKVSRFVGGSVA
jgi:hypothetical protein